MMNRRNSRTKPFRSVVAMAALSIVATSAKSAAADGGNPRAYDILFEPGNSARMLLRSQYWGLFDNRGGSPTWSLLCSQAFGGRATSVENFPTVVTRGGRILVAAEFGGLMMSDDTCTWRQSDGFGDQQVYALAPFDTAGERFVAVSVKNENGPVVSRPYATADRGDTWTKLAGTFPDDFSAASAAVAPSDPKRIYVAGVTVNKGLRWLGVSADGGASFVMLSIPAVDVTQLAPLTIVGVDPKNPDVVFVRADWDDTPTPPPPDELWVTSDAGKTWKQAYVPKSDLPGFTYSPDGTKILVAGRIDGIMGAPVADAIAGHADAFKQVFSRAVWGLSVNDGKLYAGNDDFAMKPPFMLGVSTDQGTTFTQVMNHCQVEFPTCPADSSMEMQCREQWTRVGGYVYDLLDMGECVKGMGGAGTAGVAGTSSAGVAGTTASEGAAGAAQGGGSSNGGTGSGGAPLVPARTRSSSGCTVGVTNPDETRLASFVALLVAGILCRRAPRRDEPLPRR